LSGRLAVQDIASELRTEIQHSKEGLPADAPDPIHAAVIDSGGELAQLAASSGIEKHAHGFDVKINTSHHQSIRDLGHGLRVAAVASRRGDRRVSSMSRTNTGWWRAVASGTNENDALSGMLFRALVQATRGAAARR